MTRTYETAGRTSFRPDDIFMDGEIDLVDLYRRDYPEFDRHH